MNAIEKLEAQIRLLIGKQDWARDQVEGLERQSSGGDACRNDEYWDTRDLIKQRRREVWHFDRELEETKVELEKLKSKKPGKDPLSDISDCL